MHPSNHSLYPSLSNPVFQPSTFLYHNSSSISTLSDVTSGVEPITEESSSGEDSSPYADLDIEDDIDGPGLTLLWDHADPDLDRLSPARKHPPSFHHRRSERTRERSSTPSDPSHQLSSSSPRRSRSLHPSQSSARRRSSSSSSSFRSPSGSLSQALSHSFSVEPPIPEVPNGQLSPPRPIPAPLSVRFNPRTLLRTAYGSYSSDRSGELDLASPALSYSWMFARPKGISRRRSMSDSTERSSSVENWKAFYGTVESAPRPLPRSIDPSTPPIASTSSLPSSFIQSPYFLPTTPLLDRSQPSALGTIPWRFGATWWERARRTDYWAWKLGGCCSFLSWDDEEADWTSAISERDNGVHGQARGFF